MGNNTGYATTTRFTATVVTSSSQQAAYPQSYPAAGTDVKQVLPATCTVQPTEMSAYPPQPQAANPTQGPYPPQGAWLPFVHRLRVAIPTSNL